MTPTPTHSLDGVPVPDGPIGSARRRVPRITKLSDAGCKAVLTRNYVGRLAYTLHDHVDIVPLNYAYEDGWLYGRTSPSEKLVTLQQHRWVAFEVDEVEDWYEWRSVVVRGSLYQLTEDLAQPDVRERALKALRRCMPASFADDDPVGFRTVLFGIHIDSMTGRRSTLAKR